LQIEIRIDKTAMAKKNKSKKKKITVMLKSTGKNAKGNPTGTFFVKKGIQKLDPAGGKRKLSMRKYDPRAVTAEGKIGCHVLFEEKKMPKSSA